MFGLFSGMWSGKTSALLRSSLGGTFLLSGNKSEKSDWQGAGPIIAPRDGVKLSRQVMSSVDKLGLNLRLYQYQACPYCSKVRSILDYYGFNYEVVEVNPVTRSQLKFTKGHKKVPLMTTTEADGYIVESAMISSLLKSYLILSKRSLREVLDFYPSHEKIENGKTTIVYPNKFYVNYENIQLSQEQIQANRLEVEWRTWIDEKFIHIISPNVYRTFSESLETFHYFDEIGEWRRNFATWERYLAIYVGATAMFFLSKRLKKRHGIEDERAAMLNAFNEFLLAKGPDRKFLGGDEPNLADLELHGAITSFLGTRTFKELESQCRIGEWFRDVDEKVRNHSGTALMIKKSAAKAG